MKIPRVALWLFAIYLAVYVGFVGVSAFAPAVMARTPVAGLPLSILYGIGLIVLAFVLAGLYLRAMR